MSITKNHFRRRKTFSHAHQPRQINKSEEISHKNAQRNYAPEENRVQHWGWCVVTQSHIQDIRLLVISELPSGPGAQQFFNFFFHFEETSCLRVRGSWQPRKKTKNHAVVSKKPKLKEKKDSTQRKLRKLFFSYFFPYLGCEKEMWREELKLGRLHNETHWFHSTRALFQGAWGWFWLDAHRTKNSSSWWSAWAGRVKHKKCRQPEKPQAREGRTDFSCNRKDLWQKLLFIIISSEINSATACKIIVIWKKRKRKSRFQVFVSFFGEKTNTKQSSGWLADSKDKHHSPLAWRIFFRGISSKPQAGRASTIKKFFWAFGADRWLIWWGNSWEEIDEWRKPISEGNSWIQSDIQIFFGGMKWQTPSRYDDVAWHFLLSSHSHVLFSIKKRIRTQQESHKQSTNPWPKKKKQSKLSFAKKKSISHEYIHAALAAAQQRLFGLQLTVAFASLRNECAKRKKKEGRLAF